MKVLYKHFLVPLVLVSLISFSCTSTIYKEVYPTLADGKYDSEFPYKTCSQQLESISECVKMLNCVAHYKTYIFDENTMLRKEDLKNAGAAISSAKTGYFENTAAGTATIIYNDNQRLALLTCAHVVNFEDTIFVFRHDKEGNFSKYLQSISVKVRQNNYVAELSDGNEFEILKMDQSLDIAILGKEYDLQTSMKIPKFQYPFGKAKELEWGSFVYVFGYPMGYKTLTKALVSSPNKDKSGSFIVDAVFNRGSSGGIILAIKDGVPNFEMVGMVKFIPAESEYVIKPFTVKDNEVFSPLVPYAGELYVERRSNIKYGVSKAVSIECIKDFIKGNLEAFYSKGYFFAELVGEKNVSQAKKN